MALKARKELEVLFGLLYPLNNMKKDDFLIKTTKVRLYPTKSKLERLKATMEDFMNTVRIAIDCYWKLDKVRGFRPPKELRVSTRPGNNASVFAWQIVKGAKKRKNGSKPKIKNSILILDETTGRITNKRTKNFDLWFSIIDSRKKYHRILIPAKRTIHLNSLLQQGYKLKKEIKIKFKGKKVFGYLTLSKEAPKPKLKGKIIGLDIGYRKLFCLSTGEILGVKISNLIEQYYQRNIRCPRAIKCYINHTLKQIPWRKLKILVIERLKNLKQNKKGRWSRFINRRFNNWLYGYARERLEELAKENGVLLSQVNPGGTSTVCPICQHIEATNRNGEKFKCKFCGFEKDADWVGAFNILHRFLLETAGSVAVGGKRNLQQSTFWFTLPISE